MQNELVVEASATLSYYAGCLRVARADVQRVQNHRADYLADMFDEVLESYQAALQIAEEEFRCEWQACQALQELAAPVQAKPVESRVRCPHYKAIRRAFATAKDAGLDVSKVGKAPARHAMEDVIGQCVNSRSEYSGADWMRFGDAIKSGAVRW